MPTKTQKCSICKEVGHNRRTCSQKPQTSEQLSKPRKKTKVKRVKRPVIDLSTESEDEDCCICMEKIEKVNCCTTKCGHKFCLTCFVRHSKGDIHAKCPLCRTTISDIPPPPPSPVRPRLEDIIDFDSDSDDDFALNALNFLPTMSYLQSLVQPATRQERDRYRLQQVWHT